MATKSLILELLAVDNASKTVTSFSERATSALHRVALGALEIGAAYIGFSAISNFLEGSVQAAEAAQTAHEQLQVAVDNTGASLTSLTPQVDAADTKLAKYGFTGAQVETALAQMTTGLNSPTKALKAISVAADLAKFKNISLTSAALDVTKAMEGQIKPLRALGIDIPVYNGDAQSVALAQQAVAKAQQKVNDILAKTPDAMNPASKAHAAYEKAVEGVTSAQALLNDKESAGTQILDTLSGRLSGSASKSADTYAGKLDALNAKWDDVQVKTGKAVIPALEKVVDVLDDKLVPALDASIKKLSKGDLWGAIGALSEGAGWGKKGTEDGPFSTGVLTHANQQIAKVYNDTWQGMLVGANHGWAQITAIYNDGWQGLLKGANHGSDQIGSAYNGLWQGMLTDSNKGWSQISTAFVDAWKLEERNVSTGVGAVLAVFSGFPKQIEGVFAGADKWLINSGSSIVQGLIAGMQVKVKAAVNAASSLMGSIANLFPHSPAKEGPFSGKGWTLYSGQALAAGFASGITSGVPGVRKSTTAMMGAAAGASIGMSRYSVGASHNGASSKAITSGNCLTVNVYTTGVNASTDTQLARHIHKVLQDGQSAGYIPKGALLA